MTVYTPAKGLDEAWRWYKAECRRKKKRPCRRVRATAKSRAGTRDKAEKGDSLVVSSYMNHLALEIKRLGALRGSVKHLRLGGLSTKSFSRGQKKLGRMSSKPKKKKTKSKKSRR